MKVLEFLLIIMQEPLIVFIMKHQKIFLKYWIKKDYLKSKPLNNFTMRTKINFLQIDMLLVNVQNVGINMHMVTNVKIVERH